MKISSILDFDCRADLIKMFREAEGDIISYSYEWAYKNLHLYKPHSYPLKPEILVKYDGIRAKFKSVPEKEEATIGTLRAEYNDGYGSVYAQNRSDVLWLKEVREHHKGDPSAVERITKTIQSYLGKYNYKSSRWRDYEQKSNLRGSS